MVLCSSWLCRGEDAVVHGVTTTTAQRRHRRREVHDDTGNTYPIILVHGLGGQVVNARGEYYWGREHGSLEEILRRRGFTVFSASIGPLSSNWDRACELYAQIKGGRVDYGANHSAFHEHERFGRTHPGLYPEWGEVVDGHVRKVHLVGHSMGGQTSRMLAQLLARGTTGAPIEEDPASHALFLGDKGDWVHSVMTISTPNLGTTLADGFQDHADQIEDWTIRWFGLLGIGGAKSWDKFDPQLDQWGIIPRGEDEPLAAYRERIRASHLFKPGFKDVIAWSLSTDGAAEENRWVTTLPHIYYFSVSNQCTRLHARTSWFSQRREVRTKVHGTNSLAIKILASFIGSDFTTDTRGFATPWLLNDGAVNVPSMASDGTGPELSYTREARTGHWMRLPLLTNLDHLAIVGADKDFNPTDLFIALASILVDLPAHTPDHSGGEARHSHLTSMEVVQELFMVVRSCNDRHYVRRLREPEVEPEEN